MTLRYVILSMLLLTATTAYAEILSTFDTGLEGWTDTGGDLLHVNSGGNPGGFLSLADNTNDYMTVYVPTNLLGDLSQFLGGTLSFDARNLNGAAANLTTTPLFGTVTIVGSGGTASRVLGGTGQPATDGLWHTYSALLEPALWSGSLAGALSGVTQLRVVLESNNSQPAETNGFDNFRVTPSVLPGDYNNDDKVDAADYVMWRKKEGAPAGTLPNDIDGGTIGSPQYATWRANFGRTATGSGTGGTVASVPESSTLVLLAISAISLLGRRKQSSSNAKSGTGRCLTSWFSILNGADLCAIVQFSETGRHGFFEQL